MDPILEFAETIPAVAQLESAALRQVVLRTWAASLERSPYASLADSPQAPHMPGRALVKHVNEVNQRALDLLDVARKEYGLTPDYDVTLATAIAPQRICFKILRVIFFLTYFLTR